MVISRERSRRYERQIARSTGESIMRHLLLATAAGLGLMLAGPALAQHARPAAGGHWQGGNQWHGGGQWHGTSGGRWNWSGGQWRWQGGQWHARQHWGGSIGGRWIGGAR